MSSCKAQYSPSDELLLWRYLQILRAFLLSVISQLSSCNSFSQIRDVCIWSRTLSVEWTSIVCWTFFFLGDEIFPLKRCCHPRLVRQTNPRAFLESFATSSFPASPPHPLWCPWWPQQTLIVFFFNWAPQWDTARLKMQPVLRSMTFPASCWRRIGQNQSVTNEKCIFYSFDLTWPFRQ